MKTIFTKLAIILVLVGFTAIADAQIVNYWTNGNGTGVWSDAANWSLGTVPDGVSETSVEFNSALGAAADCSIDIPVSIVPDDIVLNANYANTVSFASATTFDVASFEIDGGTFDATFADAITTAGVGFTITGGHFLSSGVSLGVTGTLSVTGGTFDGASVVNCDAFAISAGTYITNASSLNSNGNFNVSGTALFDGTNSSDMLTSNTFTLSGGTFISTPTTFTVTAFTKTGGTFTPNGGTIKISTSGSSASIANGLSFYSLTIERFGSNGTTTVTVGTTVTVNGNLTLLSSSSAQTIQLSTGTIQLKGNMDLSSYAYSSATPSTGTATINFSGTTAQSITGHSSLVKGAYIPCKVTISNTTATVSIASGNMNVLGVFTIGASATFSLGGNNLSLASTITKTGTLDASSGTITCINVTAQSMAFGAGTTINNLTINKNGTPSLGNNTVTLTDAIKITGLLTVTTGTLACGSNKLTFVSTGAGLSGQLASLGGSSNLTGSYTAQRYIPAVRNWRFLASPVTASISGSWLNNIFITGAGTGGTSCPSLTSNSNGFDNTPTNTPSFFTYTESTSTWTSISGTSTSLTPGVGYRVFVRGDRTSGTPCQQLDGTTPAPTSAVTLSATGNFSSTVNFGNVAVALSFAGSGANKGYNLVGNPYQATVNWTLLTKPNTMDAIYTWNPNNSAYGSYVAGVSANGGSQYISPGQSFFCVATASTTLTFTEASKATSQSGSGLFKTGDQIPVLWATFNDVSTTTPIYNIETAISLRDNANRTFDSELDAICMSAGKGTIQSYNSASSTKYSINSIPTIESGSTDTVYLEIDFPTADGQFSLSFRNQDMPSGISIYLVDNYKSSYTNITNSHTSYTYSTDSTLASRASDRFMVIFGDNIGSLPVVLSRFTAEKNNKNVNLAWATSSEFNSNFFDVERSINDQSNYLKIGEVKAFGNSIVSNNYNLVDITPSLSSVNYYRLKQVDINNKFTYSPVLAVDFRTGFNAISHSSSNLNVYPVPTNEVINVTLNNSYKGDVTINVYNLVGQLILTSTGTLSNSNSQLTQNVSNLSKGVYLIEVVSNDGEFKDQSKFIKE